MTLNILLRTPSECLGTMRIFHILTSICNVRDLFDKPSLQIDAVFLYNCVMLFEPSPRFFGIVREKYWLSSGRDSRNLTEDMSCQSRLLGHGLSCRTLARILVRRCGVNFASG